MYFVNEISLAFRVKEKSNFYILPMALLDNETVGKEEVNSFIDFLLFQNNLKYEPDLHG